MEDTARYRYVGGRSMETVAFRFDTEPTCEFGVFMRRRVRPQSLCEAKRARLIPLAKVDKRAVKSDIVRDDQRTRRYKVVKRRQGLGKWGSANNVGIGDAVNRRRRGRNSDGRSHEARPHNTLGGPDIVRWKPAGNRDLADVALLRIDSGRLDIENEYRYLAQAHARNT